MKGIGGGGDGENGVIEILCCREEEALGTIKLLCSKGAFLFPGEVGVEGRRGEGVRVDEFENLYKSVMKVCKSSVFLKI